MTRAVYFVRRITLLRRLVVFSSTPLLAEVDPAPLSPIPKAPSSRMPMGTVCARGAAGLTTHPQQLGGRHMRQTSHQHQWWAGAACGALILSAVGCSSGQLGKVA